MLRMVATQLAVASAVVIILLAAVFAIVQNQ